VSRDKLRFQDHILLLVLLGEAPAWLTAAFLLWRWDGDPALRAILLIVVTAAAIGGALAVRNRAVRSLRALANLLQALREGDYSLGGQDAEVGLIAAREGEGGGPVEERGERRLEGAVRWQVAADQARGGRAVAVTGGRLGRGGRERRVGS